MARERVVARGHAVAAAASAASMPLTARFGPMPDFGGAQPPKSPPPDASCAQIEPKGAVSKNESSIEVQGTPIHFMESLEPRLKDQDLLDHPEDGRSGA